MALYPDRYGRFTKNCFICFSADEAFRAIRGRDDFSARIFGLQYRRGLPELIERYGNKQVEGLEQILR